MIVYGRRTIISTTAVNMSIAIGSGIGGIVLARGLEPGPRGEYSTLFTWFLVVQAVAEAGLFGAAVYFSGRSRRQTSGLRALLARSACLQSVTVAVVLSLIVLFTPLLDAVSKGFLIGALALPILTLGGVWSFLLYGVSIRHWNISRSLQVPIYIAGLAGLTVLDELTILRAFLVYLLSVIAGQTAARALLTRVDAEREENEDPPSAREVYAYSIPSGAWSLLSLLNRRIDILILGFMISPADLGQFAVAVTIMSLVSPAIAAFGNLALPALSRDVSGGHATRKYRRRVLFAGFCTGSVVTALGCTLAVPVVPLLLGDGYLPAATLAVLIAPASLAAAMKQIAGDILRGIGNPRLAARMEFAALPISALGVVAGASMGGVSGAAVGSSISAAIVAGALCMVALHTKDSSTRTSISAPL